MDSESQQKHNDNIDPRELIQEDFQKTDSMGLKTHTFHTSSYRPHATSSSTG
jgi:hypothetical protein